MTSTMLELGLMAVALLAGGAVTGLLAGLFGVGGGAVMVPILYEVFGVVGVPAEVRMPLCVGTSLMAIIPTAISSYRKHLSKGLVEQDILRLWAVPVLLGVILGSLVARYAPAGLFKIVFVVVAGASAARLLFGNDKWKISDTLPSDGVMRLFGGLIGAMSSLMGIGGGQISNIFMMLYGRDIRQAVSTSAGLGVIIAIPGALGYVFAGWPKMDILPPGSLGYVSLIAFACIVPASIFTAPLGASLAHRLPRRRLELAFGIFLLIVCVRFLYSLATGR
ncbi:MAG: sulfite exporter TauE/SafE family protein [Hyphomicrobiales bacterium]|nr:sulfite exporter TauE/SafE family protein [Hyphomicrobiales bacterium]